MSLLGRTPADFRSFLGSCYRETIVLSISITPFRVSPTLPRSSIPSFILCSVISLSLSLPVDPSSSSFFSFCLLRGCSAPESRHQRRPSQIVPSLPPTNRFLIHPRSSIRNLASSNAPKPHIQNEKEKFMGSRI